MSKEKYLEPWEVSDEGSVLKTPWFDIKRYSCVTPLGNKIPSYYVHTATDSIMCVPVTKDNKVIIEKQWRLPLKAVSMDFPAGYAEESDKSLEAAALRELKEETGYESDDIEHLASYYKDPGFSSVQMHVFLVRDAEKKGKPTDSSELVTVELLTPEEILKAVDNGEISCALCISAALKAARKLGW